MRGCRRAGSARLGVDAADCCNSTVRVEQSTCLFVRPHQVWPDAHPVSGFTSSQYIEFHAIYDSRWSNTPHTLTELRILASENATVMNDHGD